jgi:hypothetical protein
MIGEDLHLTGGTLGIFRTPDSNPSFLNDVAANFAGLAESLGLTSLNGSTHPFVWRSYPYSGGSDHVVFNDGALRVPSVMLNRGDTFHHTSLDTMDKVDPTELRRSSFVALGTVYYLAAAGEKEAMDMARLVARNGLARQAADVYDGIETIEAASAAGPLHLAYQRAVDTCVWSTRRERKAVLSTTAFAPGGAGQRRIESLALPLDRARESLREEISNAYGGRCASLGVPRPKVLSLTSAERAALARDEAVPVRAADFVGPLETDFLAEKLGPSGVPEPILRGDAAYEALNFVDGTRTLQEIYRAVQAEWGPVDPAGFGAFFAALEKAGLIRMKKT